MNDGLFGNNQVKTLGDCAIGATFGALIVDSLQLLGKKKKKKAKK